MVVGAGITALKPHQLHERVWELTRQNEQLLLQQEDLRQKLVAAQKAAAAAAAEVQVSSWSSYYHR